MSIDTKYEVSSTSTVGGRNGHVKSETGRIDLDLRSPKELGGSGDGSNPEELFSAGYAACFNGALHFVAKDQNVELPEDTTVEVTISFGPDSNGGFGIAAAIVGSIPGMDKDQAEKLVQAAHAFCPYSKATKGNIDHHVSVSV